MVRRRRRGGGGERSTLRAVDDDVHALAGNSSAVKLYTKSANLYLVQITGIPRGRLCAGVFDETTNEVSRVPGRIKSR